MLYYIDLNGDAVSRYRHRHRGRRRCNCSSCGPVILRTEYQYIQCKIGFEGIKDGTRDQPVSNRHIVFTVYTTKPT